MRPHPCSSLKAWFCLAFLFSLSEGNLFEYQGRHISSTRVCLTTPAHSPIAGVTSTNILLCLLQEGGIQEPTMKP